MNAVTPPRLADALLSVVLPVGPKGLTILGDLHQEFADRVERLGKARAQMIYWREAIALSLRLAPDLFRRLMKRTERGDGLMSSIVADLKIGLRMLLKTPALSGIAILTIALGVGLTTHTWSSVYGSVIRGLPVPEQDRLYGVFEMDVSRGTSSDGVPWLDYLELAADPSGAQLAGYYQGSVNLAGDEAPPQRYQGGFVTANALSILGVDPALGRTFVQGEDGADASPRIVLSHAVWRDRFGSDPGIIGRTIRANSRATEVIGVMPEGFRWPFDEEVWLPIPYDAATSVRRGDYTSVFGRLPAGGTFETQSAAMNVVAERLAATFPETNEPFTYQARHFSERFMPAEITGVLYLMLFSTFGVLLIACANVANLLLARASMREQEVAVRTAIGASRFRVIRQMLAEALVLAFMGGIAGVGLSHVATLAFSRSIETIQKPYWIDVQTDWLAIGFALAVTLLAALAAGTWPAIRASGIGFGGLLRDSSRGSSSMRMGRFSQFLVISEVAVSCGLLIGAGMMIRSIANLKNVDMGFEATAAISGRVMLFDGDYPTREDRVDFWQSFEERVSGLPGVRHAALASQLPALGGTMWAISVEGDSYEENADYPVNGTIATGGFFDAVGVSFLAGRDFLPAESWDSELPVAIVNQSFVDRVLGGGNALGRSVRIGRDGSPNPFMQIVGVVPDLYVGGNTGGLGNDKIRPEHLYVTPGAFDMRAMTALIATSGPPSGMAGTLRETVSSLDPNLPVYQLQPLDEAISASTWAFGLFGSLFAIFGLAALFMSAVGLYGVMAFSVAQRRSEMGIRMALGAEPGRVLRMVLGRGMAQLGLGTLLGLGLGYGLSLPLSAVTYDVNTTDPIVYGAIVATLMTAGLVATLIPARSATRADPASSMRPES